MCVHLLHAEWKGMEKVEHRQGLSWKHELSWAAYSHCPWMPRKVVWSTAEINPFPPSLLPRIHSPLCSSSFYAELPFSFLFWFLVLCFVLLNYSSHSPFLPPSNCQEKKKENAPQTSCKVTLLSTTAAYPGGNSSLFALFKAAPLHTWYSSQMPGVYLPPGLFILKWPMETAHIFVLIRIQSWKLIELLRWAFLSHLHFSTGLNCLIYS